MLVVAAVTSVVGNSVGVRVTRMLSRLSVPVLCGRVSVRTRVRLVCPSSSVLCATFVAPAYCVLLFLLDNSPGTRMRGVCAGDNCLTGSSDPSKCSSAAPCCCEYAVQNVEGIVCTSSTVCSVLKGSCS
jgi:hypothetical protein